MPVDKACQVSVRRDHAGADARHRNQLHNQPVGQQNADKNRHLPAHLRVHNDESRKEVAERDPLQYSGNAQIVKVEIEQPVVNQSEYKEHCEATNNAAVNLTALGPLFKVSRQQKGKHEPEHNKKKRKNQVVEMKSRPRNVLELHVEQVSCRPGTHLVKSVDDFFSARDPEHVESTQCVDGSNTFTEKGTSIFLLRSNRGSGRDPSSIENSGHGECLLKSFL